MRVAINVESDMYLPEWVLQAKAKGKLMEAMKERQEASPYKVSLSKLDNMRANDKVPGYVAVKKPNDDYLVIPSLGALSADEVKYLVGMYTEGGYGIGPKKKNIGKNEWRDMVLNMADYLVEKRKGRLY
jgi:hypothetical protein